MKNKKKIKDLKMTRKPTKSETPTLISTPISPISRLLSIATPIDATTATDIAQSADGYLKMFGISMMSIYWKIQIIQKS